MKINSGAIRNFQSIKLAVILLVVAAIFIFTGVLITGMSGDDLPTVDATITEINVTGSGDEMEYEVYVSYTVDGTDYNSLLNQYSSSYKVGDVVKAHYNPDNPENIVASVGMLNIILFALGGLALVFAVKCIASAVRRSRENREYKQTNPGAENAEFTPDENTVKYYFRYDGKFTHQGHVMEDADRRPVIEAVMQKNNIIGTYEFDFVDHTLGRTEHHKVGHTVTIDEHSMARKAYFSFDGENVWDHIHAKGIRIKTTVGKAGIKPSYLLVYNGAAVANVVSSGVRLHEEDAPKGGILNDIPAPGFFRIQAEDSFDKGLLFLTVFAIARSQQLLCD